MVDGTIYIESAFGNVVAVDGKTGATRWKYTQTRGNLTRRGVAVGQGLVYTLSGDNYVVALDKDTGAVVWERQHEGFGNVEKVAVVYYAGKLLIGTNDGDRGAALAMNATNGDLLWHFWGAPGPGEFGNDTWEGDSWQEGGATPWIHPAIDPDLGTGLLHVRQRARRLLAEWLDARRRQPVRQLDRRARRRNRRLQMAFPVHSPRHLGHGQRDVAGARRREDPRPQAQARGLRQQVRDVLHPRSARRQCPARHRRSSRAAGAAAENLPTQPFPRQGGWTENCVVDQPLGTAVPGNPNRAVPNYERGCLYAAHWDVPILSIPGHGGGADWNHQSFSQSTGWVYTGFGYVASAHSLTESSNGLRPPGEYQTGGIVAVDPSTNRVRWKKRMPYSLAHGNGILTTASDLLFIGQPDGNFLALDAKDGDELWRFQTGAAISASPIAYEIDGEQYIAVYAGGTGIPYGNSAPRGDKLWAFKVGGTLPPAATPSPPVVRRPVSGSPVEGSVVNNTIVLARTYNATTNTVGATESTAVNGMAPTHLRVPRRNHGDVHQPGHQPEHPLRHAVLRRAVQLPARAR